REGGEGTPGGDQASSGHVRREGRQEGRGAEERDEDSERPRLIAAHFGITKAPEPQHREHGQRALGERYRAREADDEDGEESPAGGEGVPPARGAEQPGLPEIGKHSR